MKKQWPALVAALLMTAVIGFGMFSIGGNALFNKQGVPVQNSSNSAGVFSDLTSDPSSQSQTVQSQTAQLQSLISQYQQRDQQYQDELNSLQQQLEQANNQLQQFQMLLAYLQSRGIIQIDRSGRIFVP